MPKLQAELPRNGKPCQPAHTHLERLRRLVRELVAATRQVRRRMPSCALVLPASKNSARCLHSLLIRHEVIQAERARSIKCTSLCVPLFIICSRLAWAAGSAGVDTPSQTQGHLAL